MEPREIVRKTLTFEGPERVARSFSPSDFVYGGIEIPNPNGTWRKINDREWRRVDEWGNTWGRIDDSSKGEVIEGALTDLDDVDTVPLPDFGNEAYYEKTERTFTRHPSLWHVGFLHGLTFSMARKLRRMEQYLMDLMLNRDAVRRLHDRIDAQIKVQMEQFRRIGADSVMFGEDWGTQDRLLINPTLWREEFKPRFRTLCEHAHRLGLTMFMHSCGKMTEIIPDVIEAGVDLLQFDQPRIHGIDRLKAIQDESPVTYWCPVDIQTTLQTRNADRIRADAREMLNKLWRGRGGFVAGFYHDEESIGLDPKWQQIANEAFLKFGKREEKA